MENKESYQLEKSGANFYERNFVPALFEAWAKVTVQRLTLEESDQLLDVACGTGIVARIAKESKIGNLKITGCDINTGMLEVATEIDPDINWIKADAENLPFENDSFDKVSCQFGFMFFQDRAKALIEMDRVKKVNGKIVLGIWDRIEANEGYFDLLQIVENIGGKKMGLILKSPFNLGNKNEIDKILKSSKVSNYLIETIKEEVVFPSIQHWIDCDVKASPIAENITEHQYYQLQKEANTKLEKYLDANGKVKFNMSAHIVTIE
jgi:ubiquinone/menaquinone biosynthesis C-methylase UbiE